MKKKIFDMARECSKKSDYKGASIVALGAVAVFHGVVIAKG